MAAALTNPALHNGMPGGKEQPLSSNQPPLNKVLVIGSGPIVIGQAAEFDYAGTQACKALREEGVATVLVNSNPATIMTDRDIADRVYIEPLTVEVIERIIQRERPQGILPTLGGQTGLNLAVALADAGILERYNVRLLGTPLETIRKSEDREYFRNFLHDIGEPEPPNVTVSTMDAARTYGREMGLPLVVRPAYTLGGTGGGIANTWPEFEDIVQSGLAASPISQVLLERSLVGWKEVEYEVIRDGADNCITVCNMENLDPMGSHTGDSIVVAPSQTLTDKEYQMLRTASLKIIRGLGIEGGCNIQLALNPHPEVAAALPSGWQADSPYYVIEVNPRVSRSSALASKATGYPIARVSAKIAVGKRLDEIANAVTGKTGAAFEPALDYCVVKIPRWPFDKFPHGDRQITTQMKATGEVMAIDRSFEAALQKATRSLEIGNRTLLWEPLPASADDAPAETGEVAPPQNLLAPNDLRLWAMLAALRRHTPAADLVRDTYIDPWFVSALERIVAMERRLLSETLTPELLYRAKRLGFSDRQVGTLADMLPEQVRERRRQWNLRPVYKMVDTCAAEFEAVTPYYYSAYEQENEAPPLPGRKAVVIGSGPIRIGQGIEFDYCSVHAAWALSEAGVASVMVNSNPETVSTDFDTSDRLYFEPLDEEAVRDVIDNETLDDLPPPSVVQFGGQTAINLSQSLAHAGLPILGSSAESIDVASDRQKFEEFLSRLGIPQPPGAAVTSVSEALQVAQNIGYPVVVRPSYVLGGRAMEIVQNATELVRYLTAATEVTPDKRVLVDHYMEGKECEVDAICDGEQVLIPGIMEHIERAGVHSGDSMAIYPGLNLTEAEVATLVDYTTRIGLAMGVRGLMNIQFVIQGGSAYRSPHAGGAETPATTVYIIEVNPRGSRTIPFISKVTGVPVARLATRVMLGQTLAELGYSGGLWPRQKLAAIKAPVFSMSKLVGVDSYLGPEMKSTGEVMGIDRDFPNALSKALLAANLSLKPGCGVLLSIADPHKAESLVVMRELLEAGCRLYATEGTAATIAATGMPVTMITKRLNEGHPNVVDVINDGTVGAVINTLSGDTSALRDGFFIRRAAVERRIPCFTSLDTARAAVECLLMQQGNYSVQQIDAYLEPAG